MNMSIRGMMMYRHAPYAAVIIKENKKQFRDYVKLALNQPRLYGVARWDTLNKFDCWLFKEVDAWLSSERVVA